MTKFLYIFTAKTLKKVEILPIPVPLGRSKVLDEDFVFLLKFLHKHRKISLVAIEDHFRDLEESGHEFNRYFNGGKVVGRNGVVCEKLRNDVLAICTDLKILQPDVQPPYDAYEVNRSRIEELFKREGIS